MLQGCQEKTEICLKVVRKLLVIRAPVPSLRQATGVLGTISAAPCLSHARVPGTVKGHSTAQLITLMLRPSETSRIHRSSQGEEGNAPPHFLNKMPMWRTYQWKSEALLLINRQKTWVILDGWSLNTIFVYRNLAKPEASVIGITIAMLYRFLWSGVFDA